MPDIEASSFTFRSIFAEIPLVQRNTQYGIVQSVSYILTVISNFLRIAGTGRLGQSQVRTGKEEVAMAKLAEKKGYRLVGAINYGFNTIYIKNGIGEDILPKVAVESILTHPRNAERSKLFEPIKDWNYVRV